MYVSEMLINFSDGKEEQPLTNPCFEALTDWFYKESDTEPGKRDIQEMYGCHT